MNNAIMETKDKINAYSTIACAFHILTQPWYINNRFLSYASLTKESNFDIYNTMNDNEPYQL